MFLLVFLASVLHAATPQDIQKCMGYLAELHLKSLDTSFTLYDRAKEWGNQVDIDITQDPNGRPVYVLGAKLNINERKYVGMAYYTLQPAEPGQKKSKNRAKWDVTYRVYAEDGKTLLEEKKDVVDLPPLTVRMASVREAAILNLHHLKRGTKTETSFKLMKDAEGPYYELIIDETKNGGKRIYYITYRALPSGKYHTDVRVNEGNSIVHNTGWEVDELPLGHGTIKGFRERGKLGTLPNPQNPLRAIEDKILDTEEQIILSLLQKIVDRQFPLFGVTQEAFDKRRLEIRASNSEMPTDQRVRVAFAESILDKIDLAQIAKDAKVFFEKNKLIGVKDYLRGKPFGDISVFDDPAFLRFYYAVGCLQVVKEFGDPKKYEDKIEAAIKAIEN